MSATNLELVTFAFQKIGVVDETKAPSPEQGAVALIVLNDMLMNEAADGMNLGWYPQTDLAATAPLRLQDIHGVKHLLARTLAAHYGLAIKDPVLLAEINKAEAQLVKRYAPYFENDFSELPRAQAGPWAGPGWI